MAADELSEECEVDDGVEMTPAGTISAKEQLQIVQSALAARASEIAELQAERDNVVRQNADLVSSLRDVPKLQEQMAAMKDEVAKLRRPSLVSRISASACRISAKAIEPFVEAARGVGIIASWICWLIAYVPDRTFCVAKRGVKSIPWLVGLMFGALRAVVVIVLLGALRAIGFFTILPTMCCGVVSRVDFETDILTREGFKALLSFAATIAGLVVVVISMSGVGESHIIIAQLWCAAHGIDFTAVLHAIGWSVLGTNLFSLFYEIGRAHPASAPAPQAKKVDILTPTTYGDKIAPPLKDAELFADGPGDDALDIATLKLLPVLRDEDKGSISFNEAVNRSTANSATNWGQRAAFKVRDAGNAGKIALEVWPEYFPIQE